MSERMTQRLGSKEPLAPVGNSPCVVTTGHSPKLRRSSLDGTVATDKPDTCVRTAASCILTCMPRRRIARKPDGALYRSEFAERIGVKPPTLDNWRATCRPVSNLIPEPDGWEPSGGKLRPWWYKATVEAWEARRPNAGAS